MIQSSLYHNSGFADVRTTCGCANCYLAFCYVKIVFLYHCKVAETGLRVTSEGNERFCVSRVASDLMPKCFGTAVFTTPGCKSGGCL